MDPVVTSAVDWSTVLTSVNWNDLATGWTVAIPFAAGPLALKYITVSVWRNVRKLMKSVGR